MIICTGTNDTIWQKISYSIFRDKLLLQGARICCHTPKRDSSWPSNHRIPLGQFLQGPNIRIGLLLLLLHWSAWNNIQWQVGIRRWQMSHVVPYFKLDLWSHWAEQSCSLSADFQVSGLIACQNCCLCILLWAPVEFRWSRGNCWDEHWWFALDIPSHQHADTMIDIIAVQYCQKSCSGGSAQWPLLSSEPRFGLWCE